MRTPDTAVAEWFGDDFSQLHPLLQKLHTHGGQLEGTVVLTFRTGVAGWLSRHLARKIGIPTVGGEYPFSVNVAHNAGGLEWSRRFANGKPVRSIFRPVGRRADFGFWEECSGPIVLRLTVDIKNAAWHWRCIGVRLYGIPFPMAFMPKATAFKCVEADRYRFYVGVSLALIGEAFNYQGLLHVTTAIDDRPVQ